MRRTAVHLQSSPNAAQLEMRILANHGGDKRFAFLRGRWSRAWNLAKAKARIEKAKKEEKKPVELGGLTGYGSDDSNSAYDDPANEGEKGHEKADSLVPDKVELDDEALIQARRKRLKEWTENRRATKR